MTGDGANSKIQLFAGLSVIVNSSLQLISMHSLKIVQYIPVSRQKARVLKKSFKTC